MIDLNLKGKTAVVCGSTQGIGLASAKQLAAQGANCVLVSRNEDALKLACTMLSSNDGQQHQYLVADFSEAQVLKATLETWLSQNEGAHILINNTGGPAAGPIVEATTEQFLSAFTQHLLCNHILATCLLPFMKTQGYGRIINVVSTSVKIPLKNLGVSNTIRGAVASWAKTLSNEVARFGVTVNNVLPGATSTNRLKSIIDTKVEKTGNAIEKIEAEMLGEIPAGRFGSPEEIAGLIGFLASPSGAYINGTSTPVDGGRTGSL